MDVTRTWSLDESRSIGHGGGAGGVPVAENLFDNCRTWKVAWALGVVF